MGWSTWKKWFKDLGPQSEALMILNVYQNTPEDQVAWVRDAIDSGIKVRIQKFLRLFSKKGDLLDGISFHAYPYWPGDDHDHFEADKAFETVQLFKEYMPKWKGWMKEYYPAKAAKMDIAMTEYHIQEPETSKTADLEAGVWHAAFLSEFIKTGGTIANAWDINTTKPGEGGGHSLLDPAGDPTRPYAERSKYWIFKMMANNFTGSLVPAQSNDPKLMVYAAKDRGRTTVLLVNTDPEVPLQANIQVSGSGKVTKMRSMRLSHKEYVWSKVLYRAVVNEDPTLVQTQFTAPAEKQGWRAFAPLLEPMSVTMYVLE